MKARIELKLHREALMNNAGSMLMAKVSTVIAAATAAK